MAAATVCTEPKSPEGLGREYERTLSKRIRNQIGAFYTPAPVIDYLVEQTIGRLAGPAESIRILDPACGGGWFLLAALRRLSPGDDSRSRLTALRESIYGIDVDPGAVEVTRQALWLALAESGEPPPASARAVIKRNIRCGDALLNRFDDWPNSFDVVLGNPPYLSFSGRQAVRLTPDAERHFRQRFSSARGWMTAHGLFVERSLRDFSRRMVGFVLPDQVGHLEGYRPLREVVGELSHVVDVRYWGESVFGHAVTPALTLVTDVKHVAATRVADRSGHAHLVVLAAGDPWSSRPHAPLLKKLFVNARTLGGEVADPGVHSGNCASQLVVSSPTVSPSCRPERGKKPRLDAAEILRCDQEALKPPLLEGKQVQRYRCDAPTKSLRLDYAPGPGEYFSIRPEFKYRRARFVIRQTAAYPIVGPRRHAVYFRNSLLALYPPTDGTDAHFLVGLLNSRLLRFAYQALVRESKQQAFPQVKVGSLRRLPIRRVVTAKDRRAHDRIVAIVRRLLSAHSSREPDQRLIAHWDSRLDRLVYDLYGLTPAERAMVEEATR